MTGHNPTDTIPLGQNPPFSGRKKPTESHIADLKAKFQDLQTLTPGHNPLVHNPPFQGGSETGGYVRGVYVRQS